MRRLVHLVSCLLFCVVAQPLQAATAPARLEVAYDVFKGNMKIATMAETFVTTHDHYRIESVSNAVGLLALFKPETIRLSSEGTLTQSGLRPSVYSSQRKIDVERNTRADFDWGTKRITLTDRNGKRTLPLPADTQDRLSAMYQFIFLSLKSSSPLDFHMTNGSKLDIYNYFVYTTQSVTVPLGTFKVLYVASPVKAGESRTEIWLATDHANFPYKMTITDPEGGELTQLLTRFDFTQ
jgi:hypothetical protein